MFTRLVTLVVITATPVAAAAATAATSATLLSDRGRDLGALPVINVRDTRPLLQVTDVFGRHVVPRNTPPTAGDDNVATERNTPVTFAVAANDVSYGWARLNLASLDLDPGTAGRQDQLDTAAGSFITDCLGDVTFTPARAFFGEIAVWYTIGDNRGAVSAPARITVTVNGPPEDTLFSFEDGTGGWAAGSWFDNGGIVARTIDFATDGNHGLGITTAAGGWFGRAFLAGLNIAEVKRIVLDVATRGAGTSHSVAVQVGPRWQWCETDWDWLAPATGATIEVDLAPLFAACGAEDTSVIHGIYVYFSGGVVYDLDFVRKDQMIGVGKPRPGLANR